MIDITIDADGIATLTWDQPGRAQNVLNGETCAAFFSAIDQVCADASVEGILITSAKPDFIAGGDLEWLQASDDAATLFERTCQLHRALRKLETCGKPVAAALPGSTLEIAAPVVDRLRMVKTPAEVEELALAGAAIDRVHARVGEWLRVGRTEAAVGADHSERLQAIDREIPKLEAQLKALTERWEKERSLVERIRHVRSRLESMSSLAAVSAVAAGTEGPSAGGDGQPAAEAAVASATEAGDGIQALRAELDALNRELAELQGDQPLMRVCVDAQIVSEVISAWTGIPVGKMVKDELQTLLSLEWVLGERIIGQDHALKVISERIVSARASMDDPNKPVGVFLLVGPSGVGKTETALVLSDLLYGGERNLITINMSEFQEAHTVSTLKGAPPGYVGYGEGGVLTEAVRRRPYSVVLLDEVEKAHPDVLELFYQVFDKGMMEDGEGREIDFKNTIIMLTTNACTDEIMRLCADPETTPSPEALVKAIKPQLNKIFKPAFLGRLVIVPYYPLRDEALKKIIVLKLEKIRRRIRENHRIEFTYDDKLVDEVARRCTEVESGARNVDNILTNTLLPDISRQLLARMAEGEKLSSIRAGVAPAGSFCYEFA